MTSDRKTFLDLLIPEFEAKSLDIEKAKRWFSSSQFALDVYMKDMPDIVPNTLYSNVLSLDYNTETIKDRIAYYSKNKPIHDLINKSVAFFFKRTLFGMLKYCKENSGSQWQCPMKGDYGVYRMSWFHFVPMNILDDAAHKWLKNDTGKTLLLSVPPQHCKSTIICGALPALLMALKPDAKGLIAAYSQAYAEAILNKDFYDIISSPGYKKLFGSIFAAHIGKKERTALVTGGKKVPKDTISTKQTVHGGRLFAGSIKQMTGNPAEFLCLDDPVPNDEVASNTKELEGLSKEIQSSVESRLRRKTLMCVAQTRWAKKDPIGVMIETARKAEERGESLDTIDICFRAYYDPTDDFPYDFRVVKGQELWSEVSHTAYVRALLGDPMKFAALYQQRPIDDIGFVFKREWINRYDPSCLPSQFKKICISIDTSFTDKKTSDRVAIGVFGITRTLEYYLFDLIYDRLTPLETFEALKRIAYKHSNYTEILIEPKSSGYCLIEQARTQACLSSVIDLEPPKDSKLSRAMAVSPIVQSGKLFLPKNSIGEDFIGQMLEFRGQGKHEKDDLIDILSQTLKYYDNFFKRGFDINDIMSINVPKTHLNFGEVGITKNQLCISARERAKQIINKHLNAGRKGMW